MRSCVCGGRLASKGNKRLRCVYCRKTYPQYDNWKTKKRTIRHLVTYAQNMTPAHTGMLKSLNRYVQENPGTELHVIPGRYHNPTSMWGKGQDIWDPQINDLQCKDRLAIGQHVTVYGDVPLQSTALSPLSGLAPFTEGGSGVFGHPRLQLESIASGKRHTPRLLTTTGACTVKNYIHSKAGKKAEAAHQLGATLIEQDTDGELFHLRQILVDDNGSFIDLDKEYSARGVRPAPPAAGLVCGDVHVGGKALPEALDATFWAPDSMVSMLRPSTIITHDVLDFRARSHHELTDVLKAAAKYRAGGSADSVRLEVEESLHWLTAVSKLTKELHVVISNHHEAFDRWLQSGVGRTDPANALFYHQMAAAQLEAHARGEDPTAYPLAAQLMGFNGPKFLVRDQLLTIKGIHCHFHGHRGVNGAFGSPASFSNLGVPTITAHTHSPGIRGNNWVVGMLCHPDQDYNHLPSSWMNTNCVIYSNGKRCLLSIWGKNWRRNLR